MDLAPAAALLRLDRSAHCKPGYRGEWTTKGRGMTADRTSKPAGGTDRLHGQGGRRFDPARTVLLVIDPVNDFLSPQGAAWEMTEGTVTKHDVVGHLRQLIDGVRAQGIPVLYGPMAYTSEDYVEQELHRHTGIHRIMFERQMFLAGSWGADFHPELRPGGDEVVLHPHKGNDVFETDLPNHLQRFGTTHLVIAGMTAALCVEATGRHAMEAGYDVTFVADAIGSDSVPSYEAAVHLSYPLIANAVLDVEEFLAALDTSAAGRVRPEPGDTVRGSDRGEMGTVQEVVAATEDTEPYLRVPRGLIFQHDTYIPLDAVARRAGTDVFINVPKLVVGMMPWGEPPTREAQEAKRGPRAADVPELYGSRSPSIDAGQRGLGHQVRQGG